MKGWPPSVGKCAARSDYQHPVMGRASIGSEPIWSTVRQYRDGGIVVPDYQRPRVWTDSQQAAFLGFIMEGGRCPALFIREVDTPSGFRDEIVDGQQRIEAFRAWEDGEVPAVLPSRSLSFWVSDAVRPHIDRTLSAPTARFRGTRAEAISVYLALNTGGTPHTEDELERARALLEREVASRTPAQAD